MTPEQVFSLASAAILPGWLCLVFLPRWEWTQSLISTVLVPGILGLLYLAIFATHIRGAEGDFSSLAGVATFMSDPWLLLMGWVHYLAFDLFVGAWEVRDARRSGVHHLLVVPCLALTLMAGPVGLVLYLLFRAIKTGSPLLDASATVAD